MASAETPTTSIQAAPANAVAGGIAGLVAGIPLGIIMQVRDAGMMDLKVIDLVGDLISDPSTGLGWLVHLFNSALFGAVFALLLARWLTWEKRMSAMALGVLYGIFWWVVGGLWIMPAWLGMNEMIFTVEDNQWWSLVGHLIYGLLLVPLYIVIRPKLSR